MLCSFRRASQVLTCLCRGLKPFLGRPGLLNRHRALLSRSVEDAKSFRICFELAVDVVKLHSIGRGERANQSQSSTRQSSAMQIISEYLHINHAHWMRFDIGYPPSNALSLSDMYRFIRLKPFLAVVLLERAQFSQFQVKCARDHKIITAFSLGKLEVLVVVFFQVGFFYLINYY